MRQLSLIVVTLFVLGLNACGGGADRYRTKKELFGVVELGPFPKATAGVGGYNLYMSETKDGKFEKINDGLVLPLSKIMVPYLEPQKAYYFRMTSISSKDASKESQPGGAFMKTAVKKQ